MPFRKRVSLGFFVSAGCSLLSISYLSSEPTGFTLQSGDALPPVHENGALIIENSTNSWIDWESFSIAENEKVIFQQLHDTTYVLNRVTGGMESQLLGTLQSNGSVYLVNPNGIVIGQDALIDTAGFIASTLDLVGSDLSERIFAGDSDKGIVNRGTIRSRVGDVFLIARTVENSGTVSAVEGRQGFLSGCDVVIRSEGAPQVMIRSDEVDTSLLEENPYALAIRHTGQSVAREIYLEAAKGICECSGEIVAQKEERGGKVRLLGDEVLLLKETLIDVSGDEGGGEALIGGDFQGKNPLIKNAKHVWASEKSYVNADAKQRGDGGKVIFWSDEATLHYGKISIRGGNQSGDGGFAEVSGKILEYRGFTHGEAPFGKSGTLLLDPNDIVIGASPTSGTFSACTPPVTYNIDVATATNQILNTDLQTQLASCSVTISTVGSMGSGPNNGSIIVSNGVSWSAATNLTLHAASFIGVNAPLANTSSTSGFYAISLVADGIGAGNNTGVLLNSSVSATAANIIIFGSTSTTAVNITGQGGVRIDGLVSTTSGNIEIAGYAPLGGTSLRGIILNSGGNSVTSTSGNISLSGVSNCTLGTSTHGLDQGTSWTTGTTGTVYFGNTINNPTSSSPASISGCQGGTTSTTNGITLRNVLFRTSGPVVFTNCSSASTSSGGHGVNISVPFTAAGDVTFSNCLGGTGGGNGINISAAFTTTGDIAATNTITGRGAAGVGFASSANFSTTGVSKIIAITATSSGSSGAAHGISITGGTISTNMGGSITLNGTNGTGSTGFGVNIAGGVISTASGGGNISVTGSANGNVGVNIATTSNPIVSTGNGTITVTGTSTNSIGLFLSSTSWTTGTSGLWTLSGTGGTNGGANGIQMSTSLSTLGSISITGIGGSGPGCSGYVGLASVASTSGGSISITGTTSGSSTACYGLQLTSGSATTISTTGSGTITLNGTSSSSTTGSSYGVVLGNQAPVSASGAIQITGTIPMGATGTNVGIQIQAGGGVRSTSGPITLTGISNSTGANSHGVSFIVAVSSLTTGNFTFDTCRGGSGTTSHGINITGAFSTAGNIIATNAIQGGSGSGSIGFLSSSNFGTTGTNASIQITASTQATGGAAHGISLTGGSMSTTTGGAITLNGTSGASTVSSAASHGISLTGGASTITTATGNIILSGIALGSSTASFGINIAGSAAGVINSGSGTVTLTGTSSATATGSHGVALAAAWTPATTGSVTFSGCTGSNTGASHGVNLGFAFTGSGPVTFSNCSGGTGGGNGVNVAAAFTTAGNVTGTSLLGQGASGIGFFSNQTFSVTGTNNIINITASANGSSGNCHGISLTGGSLNTTGGGSITLNGTGSGSVATSHGINLTGGNSTLSTTTGSGNILLTGTTTSGAASFGINIAGSGAGVINSTGGNITLTGTSSATATGSHGVSVAAAWTPVTIGLITFSNCNGSNTGASHGVNLGATFTGSGPVTFTNCLGGTGGSNGVNVAAGFTTAGSVSGTGIQGQGSGGIGFFSNQTFAATGLNNSINLSASATGTTGNCHGISLSGGSMSTNNGGSITLSGTGGSSSSSSYGINLTGGASTITTATGNGTISLTGIGSGSSANYGVYLAGSATNVITSSSGAITITGTSSASGTSSYGINVAAAFNPATSSSLSLVGTGGTGGTSHGIRVGFALGNTGALSLTGTAGAGAGSYGNSLGANLTTSGGAITVAGSTILEGNTTLDATNSGAASGGASVSFSSTVDGTASYMQSLTLLAGTGGAVTFGGAIGQTTPLNNLTITSAKTSSNAVNINGNITATSFTITTLSPVTITGDTIINTTSNISFGGTIDGSTVGGQNLTLTTAGTVALGNNIGASIRLADLTITAGASSLTIGPNTTSIFANNFSVGGTIPTVLSNGSTLTINTGSATGGSIAFGGTLNGTVAGSQNLTLFGNGTGSVTLSGNVGSTRLGTFVIGAGTGAFSIGTGVTSMAANSFTVASAATTLNNSSTLTINTSVAGGAIGFGGSLDGAGIGAQNLTLNAGSGSISFTGTVGGNVTLGAMTITNALNVTSSNSLSATSFTQSAGTGTTLFNGPITLGSDMSLTGNQFTFQAPILSANNVTIVNGGLLWITSSGFMSLSGDFLQSGIGLVQTAGSINTANQDIEFDSSVTLTGNVFLNTGGTLGDITFLSTIDGPYALSLIGKEISFGANVGNTPLASLQVTGSGTISVNGDQTVSNGPMVYNGSVVLMSDSRFTDNGPNGMTFSVISGNALVGNVNLELIANNTTITVDGDIDLSGTAGSDGGSLSVSSSGNGTFTGQILTQGGDDLFATGGAGGSVSIVAANGSISIHNINTSGGSGSVSGGTGGNITLQPASSYSGNYPTGLLILNADLSPTASGNLVASSGTGGSVSGGTITLSANRSSVSTVATITSGLSGNDLTIIGQNIVMGPYEAMTILGNMTLIAPALTLGDLVAMRDLTIFGATINLRTHGDISILANNGLLYTSPSLHFLSGGAYLQVGSLNPADGILNAQDLDLSVSQFRPLLLYQNHILNYDTSPKPLPIPPFVATEASKQYVVYLLTVADAQLSDLLPVYSLNLPSLYELCDAQKSNCSNPHTLLFNAPK